MTVPETLPKSLGDGKVGATGCCIERQSGLDLRFGRVANIDFIDSVYYQFVDVM